MRLYRPFTPPAVAKSQVAIHGMCLSASNTKLQLKNLSVSGKVLINQRLKNLNFQIYDPVQQTCPRDASEVLYRHHLMTNMPAKGCQPWDESQPRTCLSFEITPCGTAGVLKPCASLTAISSTQSAHSRLLFMELAEHWPLIQATV